MICEKCGEKYITKECMKCKTTEDFINKTLGRKTVNKKIEPNKIYPSKQNNYKDSKTSIMKTVFVFLLIISITATGLMYLKTKETIEKNNNLARIIKKLESDNIDIKNRLNEERELISRYKNNARQLAYENSRLKRNNNISSVKPKTYTKRTERKQVYIKPKTTNNTYIRPKVNTPPRTYTKQSVTAPVKKYQRFSSNIKLKSDSKINIKSDNRLQSNLRIYGRYYPRKYSVVSPSKNQVSNINCNLSQNIYKVVDECSMTISDSFDKVYLGKMNIDRMKTFDRETHMIECIYSQNNGLMHDCKVKLKAI